jgi:uncharacterized protein (DUF2141 family)
MRLGATRREPPAAAWRRRAWRAIVGAGLASVAFGLVGASATPATPHGEIRVRVTGLQSDAGQLRFGLFDRKETFATSGGAVVEGGRPIHNRQCEFVIPDLPYGTYALMVAHDVNGDGHIDRSPFSPELKGISNYTSKVRWFPDFDKAKFKLDRPSVVVNIRVY